MSKKLEKDVIIFNDRPLSKKKKSKLYADLDSLDEIVLPSSIKVTDKNDEEKKVTKVKAKHTPSDDDLTWLNEMMYENSPNFSKKLAKEFSGFNGKEKGKKKKNKSEGGPITYDNRFNTELNALQNLHINQNKFITGLQASYNEMDGKKANVRGIGKFKVDLITAISGARSVDLSIIDKIVGIKKTIADLNMKEREKFGKKNSDESENNAAFASSFLNNIIAAGAKDNSVFTNTPAFDESNVMDIEELEANNLIDDLDIGIERSSDADQYLKYENSNVKISVIRDAEGNWDFYAEDEDGNPVPDYPLPEKGHMTFNDSMHIAIDDYNRKYDLIDQ